MIPPAANVPHVQAGGFYGSSGPGQPCHPRVPARRRRGTNRTGRQEHRHRRRVVSARGAAPEPELGEDD